MGQRGPKPKSTNVLELRGSWLAKARPEETTRPLAMIPPCPAGLDRQGKRLWKTLTQALNDVGLLTSLDQQALARYILLLRRWQRLQEDIERNGETMPILKRLWITEHEDSEGHLVPGHHETYVAGRALRPEVNVWLALSDRLLRLEQQFGLTPSGRAGIGLALAAAQKAAPEGQQDPRRFLQL